MKITMLFFFFLILCDSPFQTRESEEPVKIPLNWTPTNRPDDLLLNFQNALNYSNVAYYLRCLDPNYIFVADENESSPFNPDSWKYINWNYHVEQEVITRFFEVFRDTLREDNQIIEFNLIRTEIPDIENPRDSVLIYRDYQMSLYHSYPQYPIYCEGTAEFILKEDESGFWTIQKMKDIRKDTTDWGELKGLFRY